MDSHIIIPIAAAIATFLGKAVLPYLSQKVVPELAHRLEVNSKTQRLDSPEQLNDFILNGVVKSGQFVEGYAFFSLHTDAFIDKRFFGYLHERKLAFYEQPHHVYAAYHQVSPCS